MINLLHAKMSYIIPKLRVIFINDAINNLSIVIKIKKIYQKSIDSSNIILFPLRKMKAQLIDNTNQQAERFPSK